MYELYKFALCEKIFLLNRPRLPIVYTNKNGMTRRLFTLNYPRDNYNNNINNRYYLYYLKVQEQKLKLLYAQFLYKKILYTNNIIYRNPIINIETENIIYSNPIINIETENIIYRIPIIQLN